MDYICKTCKHYNHKEECCWLARDMFFNEDEHCCIYWEDYPTEEEIEAQRTDAAERENHRREVED